MNIQTTLRPQARAAGHVFLRAPLHHEASEIGALLSTAFTRFQTSHGFGSDFDTPEGAAGFVAMMLDDPLTYAVVAERDGCIVGVNFLSEGDPVRGVGPIAIAPDLDDRGIGRRLMHDVIQRAKGAVGVRLLQDTFNLKSLALYTSLGFRVREPYVVLKGRLNEVPGASRTVRPLEPQDLARIGDLARKVTGFPRGSDARRALSAGTPYVVIKDRQLTGYATDPGNWAAGHAVATSEEDFKALLLGVNAAVPRPLQFLFPTRCSVKLRWLLSKGLRAEKQMLLMTRGTYRDPDGVYVPSVLY